MLIHLWSGRNKTNKQTNKIELKDIFAKRRQLCENQKEMNFTNLGKTFPRNVSPKPKKTRKGYWGGRISKGCDILPDSRIREGAGPYA